MKKIIIAYASYGGGHLKAATNLKEYIEENYPDSNVILFDSMKYINRVIDKVCGSTYSKITTNLPWFWGQIYYHTQDPIFEKIMSLSNKLLSYKLGKLFKQIKPDIIISTHFFVGHMCSILKKKGKIGSILANVITDYGEDPYNEWISGYEYIDYIFVAHNEMKKKLTQKGVPENKVFDTGIPVSNKFLTTFNKKEIFKEFDLKQNKKTILFFGGGELGLGKTKTLEIFKTLVTNFNNIQIIVVAGKNDTLKKEFEKIVIQNNKTSEIKVLGYTTKVAEYMHISDVVFTKPGGLTTTESLISGLPIIVINPIPGQETENAEFLEENGAALWIKKMDDINIVFKNVIYNNDILNSMKQNALNISKPNSTKDICSILLQNTK